VLQVCWMTLTGPLFKLRRRNQLKLMMLLKITRGLIHVENNLPLTYSNLDNILRGHTLKFTKPATRVDCYKFSLIFPLDHQLMEHFTPISGWSNEFKNNVIFVHNTHFWVLYLINYNYNVTNSLYGNLRSHKAFHSAVAT